MTNLNKVQAQAIISKLGREAEALRQELIREATLSYTPSKDAQNLIRLAQERDDLKVAAENAVSTFRKEVDRLGLKGVYAYSKVDDVFSAIKNKEVQDMYLQVDLDEALDDLIIESTKEDFTIEGFIEQYLNKIRNG